MICATPTALPTKLQARGISLRPEQAEDSHFLRELYLSTRWDELTANGWPEAAIRVFLEDQFRLQCLHYQRAYYDASFAIVLQAEEPIGRLYVHRGARDHRVVDISIAPPWRGQGIGGELMRAVQSEALAAGCKASVHVETFNPARRLYQRLGFMEVEDKGIYILMEWHTPTTHADVSDQLKMI